MIPSIESTQLSLVLKQPMGVVGAIVPWNYPLLLLSWKLAPALAASNASGQAVGADAALDARAGGMLHHLPPGVPNLLAGAGDGRIDCVAFTGSVDTGKRIAATCAERVARTGSARPSTRATCGRWSGACTRSRPGPFVQRSADRQRRRPLRRLQQSGLGRELGEEGLEAFQETKHVHIESSLAPKPWWYPYAPGAPVPPE